MFKISKSKKIILFVSALIVLIFSIQIFQKPNIDRNSYVTLVSWTAMLNNNPLILKQKEVLKVNDIIKTGNSWSLAIIEWWEWSITRLWENTTIKISQNNISPDLTSIQILFKIIWNTWKTWSDVVSFIWEKSYFKEGFVDTEAAVRWTTFEVNLDKNYLYVKKHAVWLTDRKTNKTILVTQNKPFNLKTFNFIAIEKFILDFQDKVWEWLNKDLDKQFFNFLNKNLDSFIKTQKDLLQLDKIDFEKLSDIDKNKLYKQLLASYQQLKPSTISPNNTKLYDIKLKYQKALLSIAPVADKKDLLETTLYDLNDSINSKNFTSFKQIVTLLWKNKEYINMNQLNNIINFNQFWQWFKKNFDSFIKNFNFDSNIDYNKFFGDNFESFWKSMNSMVDNITWWLKDNFDKFSDTIWWEVNNLTNKVLNK